MNEITSEYLLGLSRNFMESRVLLSAAELDVFTHLADHPQTAAELALAIKAEERGVRTLMDALVSMGVVEKDNEVYSITDSVASLLSSHAEKSILPMIHHASHMWNSWSRLTTVVRPNPELNETMAPDGLQAFIGAMHVIASPQADRIIRDINPRGAKNLLDIGGASGTYTIAFLKASPQLKATIFDRPKVIEMARKRLSEYGLLDRVTLVPGDFYADALPKGYDLAFLSAIIHQNSRIQNVDLYRKAYTALDSGGRLVIRDHVMSEDHTQPKSGALFAINMLVGTEGGGTYSFSEIHEDLEVAGFVRIAQLQSDSNMSGLVEAYRP
jgi:protein-L-isoaspartate O-methyltransferase